MTCSPHKDLSKLAVIAVALGASLGLAGCAAPHLSADFGQAVRQDMAAQIANPDAKFAGVIAPGSNPARVAAAQDRYVKGKVIPPSAQVAAASVAAPSATPLSGLIQ